MDDKHQQNLDRAEEQLAQLEALQARQHGEQSERAETPASRLREDVKIEKDEQPQGFTLPFSIPALRGLKVSIPALSSLKLKVSRPSLWLAVGLVVALLVVVVIIPILVRLLTIGIILLAGAGVVWYAMRRLSSSG